MQNHFTHKKKNPKNQTNKFWHNTIDLMKSFPKTNYGRSMYYMYIMISALINFRIISVVEINITTYYFKNMDLKYV